MNYTDIQYCHPFSYFFLEVFPLLLTLRPTSQIVQDQSQHFELGLYFHQQKVVFRLVQVVGPLASMVRSCPASELNTALGIAHFRDEFDPLAFQS